MNKEPINGIGKHCFYCPEQFIPEDFQKRNYRVFKGILSPELAMMFHKKCWTKFSQGTKKAWQQIKKDPIYCWSMGKP